MKTYKAEEVAEYFLVYAREKGDFLSNKKLQKLLYYAQAWHLVNFSRPLFSEEVEAWVHGPVVRSVYNRYKRFSWNPITPPNRKLSDFDFGVSTIKLLNEVFRVYGDHSADFLEALVHTEEPWLKARGNKPLERYSATPIEHQSMKRYYSSLLSKRDKKN